MPIRMARLEDIPALVEGGRRMHALTRFKHFDYLPEKVARSFEAIILQGQNKYVFMVAEGNGGRLAGALIGVREMHLFANQIAASIVHIAVLPETRMGGYGLKLLLAFERWAEASGAAEICIGQNSAAGKEEVALFHRLAMRRGYKAAGFNYFRTISGVAR